MNLENMTNEELIVLAKESGDEYIKNYFFERNMDYVHFVANKFFVNWKYKRKQDYDDIFSAGQLGFVKAYNRFDIEKGINFSTFLHKVITNEILILIRNNRKDDKYGYLSTSYPIDQKNDSKELYLEDALESEQVRVDRLVELNLTIEECRKNFSEYERMIYELCIGEEKNQREIAKELNLSQSYVSRIFISIKRKLSA